MKTFKTRIYLDDKTKQYCERAFGVRRFVWNWALAQMLATKATTNIMPSNYVLDKEFRKAVKAKQDAGFEWIANQAISGKVMEECLKDLVDSFKLCREAQKDVNVRHLRNMHKPADFKGERKAHRVQPHFMKRKQLTSESFRYYRNTETTFRIDSDFTVSFNTTSRTWRGVVRTRESLAFLRHPGVKLCEMTIKREADKYWICLSYEKLNRAEPAPVDTKVGIDLGVKISAACFDGTNHFEANFNTDRSRKLERMAKAHDVSLSRKTPGSNRYMRELALQQKRCAKAARIRKYQLENFTTGIIRNYQEVVLDDFNFGAALNVAKPEELYRCMHYQTKLRLEQKAADHGNYVHYVEHYLGKRTTAKCSQCGSEAVHVIKGTRTMVCRHCGHTDDRDKNAAACTYLFN